MRNNKGFSLLEIMAVLAISTIILVPLLSSLSNAYNANTRAQQRSNALSITESTMLAIEKVDFGEMRSMLDDSQGNLNYVELNKDNCQTFTTDLDTAYCDLIFSQIWNNEEYDSSNFHIYLFDFRVEGNTYQNFQDGNLPDAVKRELEAFQDFIIVDIDGNPNNPSNKLNVESLIRVVVWINYNEDPYKEVATGGMIVDE